jgi:LAS superfamily LD-carboxypeptidase LdcB
MPGYFPDQPYNLTDLARGMVDKQDFVGSMNRGMEQSQMRMARDINNASNMDSLNSMRGLRALLSKNPNASIEEMAAVDPIAAMEIGGQRAQMMQGNLNYQKGAYELDAAQHKELAAAHGAVYDAYHQALMQGQPPQQALELARHVAGDLTAQLQQRGIYTGQFDPNSLTEQTIENYGASARSFNHPLQTDKYLENQQQFANSAQLKGMPSYGDLNPAPQVVDGQIVQFPPRGQPGMGMPTGGLPQGNPFRPAGSPAPAPSGGNPDAAAANPRAQGMTPEEFHNRLDAMIGAARSAGLDVSTGSGYRSIEQQQQIYDRNVAKYGSANVPGHQVARPGHSMHNFDLANDLKFGSPEAQKWVHQHAADFGLHFPVRGEGWHVEAQPGWHAPQPAAPVQVAANGVSVTPIPGMMTQEQKTRLEHNLGQQDTQARIRLEEQAAESKAKAQQELERKTVAQTRVDVLEALPPIESVNGLIDESIGSRAEDLIKGSEGVAGALGIESKAQTATAQLGILQAQLQSTAKSLFGAGAITDYEQGLMQKASGKIADPSLSKAARREAYQMYWGITRKAVEKYPDLAARLGKSQEAKPGKLRIGDVVKGHQFIGGDPKNPKSWKEVP